MNLSKLTRRSAAAGTLALIGVAATAGGALADNVQNDVTVGGNDTITAGGRTTVNYRIKANSGDDEDGCNATAASPATVTVSTPSGVSADTTSLVFTSCDTNKPVVFSSSSVGNHTVTVSVQDSGVGSYNVNPGSFTLKVNEAAPNDTTAPVVTYLQADREPNANGWYNADVTATFEARDADSGPALQTGTATSSGEGSAVVVDSPQLSDDAGNIAPVGAAQSEPYKIDKTRPSLSLVGGPQDGATYYFGDVPAAPEPQVSDALSGIDGSASVTGYGAGVDAHAMEASVKDRAGNTTTETVDYTVLGWTFSRFFSPVDMDGVVNTVKGGSTVPIKFQLFKGTDQMTDASKLTFSVQPVQCDGSAPQDSVENLSTGGTSLRYDTTAGQFIQNWKTPTGKTGQCYQATMSAADGSTQTALFKMK